MTYVITEPCVGVCDQACVKVCPVECIHPPKAWDGKVAGNMFYIDPDECIDCAACVDECPVEAIFAEDDLPAEMEKWTPINAERFT